ncbi:ferrochelatase [Longibacter salinarum]|nr:ferrochelatase [Longibacter salinarum]
MIGIVCMGSGGPSSLDDVSRFLYDLYMDPARLELGMGGFLRHLFARLMSNLRSSVVRDRYEMIGGRSPLLRMMGEQTGALERHLIREYHGAEVEFRTYVAHRHGTPSFVDAARQMEEDGVDRVVLLPLVPQYALSRTRSWIQYWETLEHAGEIPSWPRTAVHEYAANPKYVQALSERIDEATQRFPKESRSDIHLLFTAAGLPPSERDRRCDPSCCLVCSTVDHVMRYRDHDHPFSIAFQPEVGPPMTLMPSVEREIDRLAGADASDVLVVPVSFVTDRLETCVHLDIELRDHAYDVGIESFEVTSGLNTHPLFVEALAEAVVSQCHLSDDMVRREAQGDSAPSGYPLPPLRDLATEPMHEQAVTCPACTGEVRPKVWGQTVTETILPRPSPRPFRMTPMRIESSRDS